MTTRIAIDLNVRVRGNGTFSGFENVDGPLPQAGDHVTVYETETELTGNGRVTEVDATRRLIFLRVDWSSLHERSSAEREPSGLAAYASTNRLMAASPVASGATWPYVRQDRHDGR